MPGDVVPTAATLSPTPIACSALTACGLTLTAAPISPRAGAVSNTSARIPWVLSACAAASPASPPPTLAIPQLDDIGPSKSFAGTDIGAYQNPRSSHQHRQQDDVARSAATASRVAGSCKDASCRSNAGQDDRGAGIGPEGELHGRHAFV